MLSIVKNNDLSFLFVGAMLVSPRHPMDEPRSGAGSTGNSVGTAICLKAFKEN